MTTLVPAEKLLSEMKALGLRPLHILIVILCGLGYTFDLAEVAMGNVLSAVFSTAPNIAGADRLSWLLAAPYIGGFFGAAFFGWLADKVGRKFVLIAMLLLLGLTSLMAVWSHDIETLTIARIVSGLALGGYPPVVMAFLTDHLPAEQRGGLVMAASAVSALGAPLSIFLVRGIGATEPLGLVAWKWGFLTFGSGAIMVGLLFNLIPETVRWLTQARKYAAAEATLAKFSAGREIFTPAKTLYPGPATAQGNEDQARIRSWQYVISGLFHMATPWATVAYPLLSGAVLIQKGVKLPDALLYIGIAALAPCIGMIASSFLLDRFGRRVILWATGSLMALSAYSFVIASAPMVLIASGFLFQIGYGIFLPTSSLYFAEIFRTTIRAQATSWLWALNRVSSGIAPLILIPLLRSQGALLLVAVMCGALILSMSLLIQLPPGRAHQEVN